jgi:hypothetical protein
MLERLAVAGTALAIALAGAWKVAVAEYFGRVELSHREAEHPSPTAPRADIGPQIRDVW